MRVIEHNHICRQPPNNAPRAVHFPPCLCRNAGLRPGATKPLTQPMTPILQHSIPQNVKEQRRLPLMGSDQNRLVRPPYPTTDRPKTNTRPSHVKLAVHTSHVFS